MYAEATIDLLEFAMQPGRTIKHTLPLAQGKRPSHAPHLQRQGDAASEGVALSGVFERLRRRPRRGGGERRGRGRPDGRAAQQSTTAFEQHTKQVVTTTTEITGVLDDDGNFVEEDRTQEEIVREAMDNTMTA